MVRNAALDDATSDRVVLFGGETKDVISDETWAHDFNAKNVDRPKPGSGVPVRPRTSKRRQATPGSSSTAPAGDERENLQYFQAIRVKRPANS